MDFLKNNERTNNKYLDANIFSKLSFSYVSDIFKIGNKRLLEKTDVSKNLPRDNVKYLQEKLKRKWKYQTDKHGKKPSFFWALLSFASTKWMFLTSLFFVREAFRITQPLFLKMLLDVIARDDFGKSNEAFIWAGGLLFGIFIQLMVGHPAFHYMQRLGINLRSATLGLVYEKIFRLRQSKLGAISVGHVVTLISSDAHKLQEGLILSQFLVIAPLELIFVTVVLWRELGISCLPGIAVVILMLPFQSWVGKVYAHLRHKTVKKTDQRVRLMNEIISSMQVTKMYGWEESFSSLVKKIRSEECTQILKAALMKGFNASMYSSSSYVVLLATFVTFYFQNGDITLGKIYFTMSLLFVARLTVIYFFPTAIQMMTEFYVSCKRIEKFLLQEEIPFLDEKEATISQKNPYVSFENVSAAYEGESLIPVLKDITFKADEKNNLVIINGPVGSGKTSVLMAALNEIRVTHGKVDIKGTVAYSPQQAWIFCGTVRQNILFGNEYDEKFYEKVIDACALRKDIESFGKGDLTLVGEKGVSLSGGQKARIGLARAVYADSDIYYLDDPLSAVDTKVGKHIFEKCIQTFLKDKVVILVTHQVQYIDQATQVIGLSLLKSTYSEPDLLACSKALSDSETATEISEEKNINEDLMEIGLEEEEELEQETDVNEKGIEDELEEKRVKGTVSMKVYFDYFTKGAGWLQSILVFFLLISVQGLLTFTDYWVGEWAQGEDLRLRNETSDSKFLFKDNPEYNMYLFAGLVGSVVFLNTFRVMYSYQTMVKSSRQLHNRMFDVVLRVPMYFFDKNPVGQILNRFSRDVFLMDDELPKIFVDFIRFALLVLAVIILNCINVPYILIVLVILMVAFYYLRRYYLKVSREVRRLECVARSPLYSHISATLCGVTSIRALNMKEVITEEFHRCLDYQTEAWIFFTQCATWFSQRIDFMAFAFIIAATFAPLLVAKYVSSEDRGLIGVSFAYLLNLCGFFQYCVRQSAEVDNLMTSVERVLEYTRLEPEKDAIKPKELPKGWPTHGKISAKSVSYAYYETLPNVLKNISFVIEAKEKIGIVGRSGAGKSTLFSMLFRLGKNDGLIEIDGIDISQIKLQDLRKALSVIPQDPVLFGASLRENLDPFHEYNDEDIWNALEEVQLKKAVEEFKNKLQTEITESGSNLSVGEKQLLCLARALLKKSKVLMIDEATANVDNETDVLIQKTIREKFKECTVLTIAHRLNTVMDSDRILVIHDGEIAESGDPHTLLQNESGHLKKLVDQTGKEQAKELENLAKENSLKNNSCDTAL